MMKSKIFFTPAYEEALQQIENFIFSISKDLEPLLSFHSAHDATIRFIAENPTTPATHPATGDQSWPFEEGRYRVFFIFVKNQKAIYMIHIIDNRQANLKIYPGNSLPTYDEE
jgi:hypothetical protein